MNTRIITNATFDDLTKNAAQRIEWAQGLAHVGTDQGDLIARSDLVAAAARILATIALLDRDAYVLDRTAADIVEQANEHITAALATEARTNGATK